MKLLKNVFDNLRPNFEEGGKLERYYKAFEAIETFAFVPGHVTHDGAHVRDSIDLKRTMFLVVIATIPALLF
jgi:Na+-transporting NADH:ubiquinone oxidoreductase subunit B